MLGGDIGGDGGKAGGVPGSGYFTKRGGLGCPSSDREWESVTGSSERELLLCDLHGERVCSVISTGR